MPSPLAPSDAACRLVPRFGLDAEGLEPLDGFESEVLVAHGLDGEAIVKLMAPSHRTPDEVRAEIDWLLALRAAGVSVARPLPTSDGSWLVTEGDPPLIAVAYERSPGRHLPPDAWTPDLFYAHGVLVGQLQAHARCWSSAGPRRAGWLDHQALDRAAEALPGDTTFLEGVAEVAKRVAAAVPQGAADVGLIHADLHAWNVLVDEAGTLTAIDFDDAVVGPYLYDLVMPLYYAVTTRGECDPSEAAEAFLRPYLEGFDTVAQRPAGGADAVAALLAMRQADLAIFVRLDVPEDRWDDDVRAAAKRLRDRTAACHEVVPLEVLRRHFGD